MARKLQMRHHKALLSATLVVVLVIGVVFGIAMIDVNGALPVATFALVLLLIVLSLVLTSMLFRTRDELHALNEELTGHIQAVPARIAAEKAKK